MLVTALTGGDISQALALHPIDVHHRLLQSCSAVEGLTDAPHSL